MKGITHAIETAIRYDRLADVYRKIARQRTEDHLKTLETTEEKMEFVDKVFEGVKTGRDISLVYNLKKSIEKESLTSL